MKAVILAAGEGSRLHPITLTTPKPLVEVNGKTIIEHIFLALPESVDEVVVVVGHLQDKIKNYLGSEFLGKKVYYAEQGEKKGTLGALWAAKDLLGDENFMVLNGDDLHDRTELEKFILHKRAFGIQHAVMPNYYFVLGDSDGNLAGFRPQSDEEKISGSPIATGTYVLDSKIFEHPGIIVNGGEYGLPQTIDAQKAEYPVRLVITRGWLPINSLDDLENAENRNLVGLR
ncbi:MAG: nucleotidyltransferase family protein [Patescibacteria group bacterium]